MAIKVIALELYNVHVLLVFPAFSMPATTATVFLPHANFNRKQQK